VLADTKILVGYFSSDFGGGIKYGLDASLVLFKAWGLSLMEILEKIFADIAMNMTRWIQKGLAIKSDRFQIADEMKRLAQNEVSDQMGVIMGAAGQAEYLKRIDELTEKKIQDYLDSQQSRYESRYPSVSSGSWDSVGKKIEDHFTAAMEKIGQFTPSDLSAELTTAYQGFQAKIDEIEKNFAQNQSRKYSDFNESGLTRAVNAFSNASIFTGPAAATWQRPLTVGTNETALSERITSESLKAQKALRDLFADLENEKKLIGLTTDERERAIETTKAQTAAEAAFGKGSKEAQQAIADYSKSLAELSRMRASQNMDDMLEQLDKERELITLTNEEREYAIQLMEYQRQAVIAYGEGTAEAIEATERFKRKLSDNKELRELKLTADGIGQAFTSNFTDIIWKVQDAEQAVSSFSKQLANLVLQYTVMTPIAQGISAAIMGGFPAAQTAAPTLSAFGNVFSGGNLIPFASGGIVTRPTIFPMANGAGLMGEAGPEAIMPLKRRSDGRLGVASDSGGVAVQNQVNVYNQSGQPIEAKAGETKFDGQKYVTDVFIRDMTTNGPISRSLKQMR
ncbi:MAG TPA: hypothetical protein PKB02_13135, partial [Anaerohalosphaeraceae bacterium]|nr:hypothetical protein [Anaerohalosphaeraceae bacterium]